MTFVEWVGFVASLMGVVYLFTKDALAKREKKRDPIRYAEKERRLKEVLRHMGVEPEDDDQEEEDPEEEEEMERKGQSPLPPLLKPERAPLSSSPPTKPPVNIPLTTSRVAKMVAKLPDKRALLVSQILFGPPKSLE